jgi:hypothetical protein
LFSHALSCSALLLLLLVCVDHMSFLHTCMHGGRSRYKITVISTLTCSMHVSSSIRQLQHTSAIGTVSYRLHAPRPFSRSLSRSLALSLARSLARSHSGVWVWADVAVLLYGVLRMLTYADVCRRMPTYGYGQMWRCCYTGY